MVHRDMRIAWFLVVLVGCAGSAIGQTVPAKLEDAGVTSAPVKVTRFEDPPESSTAPVASSSAGPGDSVPAASDSSAATQSGPPPTAFTPLPHAESAASERFQWKPALGQSALFTVVMHGWRFAHEPGTRDATGTGPGSMTGSIPSAKPAAGMTATDGMPVLSATRSNGAIFGFIEQQNDPLYRKVEWGDGRIYWMSRLRALAFSAVMSTQWTLGPVSEASLGNVQLHASPGFIDLVTLRRWEFLTMMGEDMLDRYVIMPLENHTANPWLIMVTRGLGNPAAHFREPDGVQAALASGDRPGLFGENHAQRKELVQEYKDGIISAPYGPHTAAERALMNKDADKTGRSGSSRSS